MRRFLCLVWTSFALLLVSTIALQMPSVAWAEGGASRDLARQRFQQGVALIEQERWEDGLREFEASYETYPTQAALFNRALCLRLLRRYGEAIAALAEYRNRYADQVSEDRMAEVETELHTIQGLVGRITVVLQGASSAEVYVDGERMGAAPTFRPIVVAPGSHEVEIRASGFSSYRHSMTLSSGDEMTIRATMTRAVTNAALDVTVNVPGARVSVDGSEAGTSPLSEPVAVVAGSHTIEVTRAGYQRAELTISVGANGSAAANIELRPIATLPSSLAGQLAVTVNQADAEIYVDGQLWSDGPLPIGPHSVEVRHDGYQNFRQEIEINQGQSTPLQVTLVPGVSEPVAGLQGERNRAFWLPGIISGAVGVVAVGVGIALIGANSGRQDEWDEENGVLVDAWDTVNAELARGVSEDNLTYNPTVLTQRTNDNNELSDSISSWYTISYVLLGIGGAAIAAAVPLLILGLRRRPAASALSRSSFALFPTPGGAGFGASLRF